MLDDVQGITNNVNTYAKYDEGHETNDHTDLYNNTNTNIIEKPFTENPHNYWIPSGIMAELTTNIYKGNTLLQSYLRNKNIKFNPLPMDKQIVNQETLLSTRLLTLDALSSLNEIQKDEALKSFIPNTNLPLKMKHEKKNWNVRLCPSFRTTMIQDLSLEKSPKPTINTKTSGKGLENVYPIWQKFFPQHWATTIIRDGYYPIWEHTTILVIIVQQKQAIKTPKLKFIRTSFIRKQTTAPTIGEAVIPSQRKENLAKHSTFNHTN
ncbi:23971_t:CDS:2 [Cetraspora pellucida]|uniref:23971_t:CDS:1 n=1 Tax=Cetraspora pellucida TaxID=1433469 RepID=A0A9N8WA12_9GLOM|nr:23971_t:CDS:2 [Cetraspora pellucida]